MSVQASFTISGDPKKALQFKERVQTEATARGLSFSELVVEAIAEYLRKNA